MRVAGAYKWEQVNLGKVTDTTSEVKGMREETDYEFRVIAENKAGCGKPSQPSRTTKFSK